VPRHDEDIGLWYGYSFMPTHQSETFYESQHFSMKQSEEKTHDDQRRLRLSCNVEADDSTIDVKAGATLDFLPFEDLPARSCS